MALSAIIARLRCEHPGADYSELCRIAAQRGAAKRKAQREAKAARMNHDAPRIARYYWQDRD